MVNRPANSSNGVCVQPPERVFIIGEILINQNGSLDITRKLIDMAKAAGCDAVKFQKRTIDILYPRVPGRAQRESLGYNAARAKGGTGVRQGGV